MGFFSKIFGKKSAAPDSPYEDLRRLWLQQPLPGAGNGPGVQVVMVEFGVVGGRAALLAGADSSVSLLFSPGGGVLGAGAIPAVAEAARELLQEAEKQLPSLSGPAPVPVAKSGEILFCVRTPAGVFVAVDAESAAVDAAHHRNPFHRKAQDLMNAVRVHGYPIVVSLHGDGGLLVSSGDNPAPTWCTLEQLKEFMTAVRTSQARRVLHAPSAGGKAFDVVLAVLNEYASWERTDAPPPWPDSATSLHVAIVGNRLDIVSDLIARGAETTATDRHGYDALLTACYLGTTPVVQAVLDTGADPNRRDLDGNTPLMFAAQRQDAGSVRSLLRAGADPTLRGPHGFNALEIAKQYPGNPTVAVLHEALASR